MVILGIIAAVAFVTSCIGYIFYRRYKRREEDETHDVSTSSFKERDSNIKLQQSHMTGSSPLKGDVTSYDEEAADE